MGELEGVVERGVIAGEDGGPGGGEAGALHLEVVARAFV